PGILGERSDDRGCVGAKEVDPAYHTGDQRISRYRQDPGRVDVSLLALDEDDPIDTGRARDFPQIIDREVTMDRREIRCRPGAAVLPEPPKVNVGVDHATASSA